MEYESLCDDEIIKRAEVIKKCRKEEEDNLIRKQQFEWRQSLSALPDGKEFKFNVPYTPHGFNLPTFSSTSADQALTPYATPSSAMQLNSMQVNPTSAMKVNPHTITSNAFILGQQESCLHREALMNFQRQGNQLSQVNSMEYVGFNSPQLPHLPVVPYCYTQKPDEESNEKLREVSNYIYCSSTNIFLIFKKVQNVKYIKLFL